MQAKREEIIKKALSSASAALAHAEALASSLGGGGNPGDGAQGPGGVAASGLPAAGIGSEGAADTRGSLQRAYASALRCRLEIQYALLLIQKGLSIEIPPSAVPPPRSAQKARLAEGLKADLEGALSALASGSPDGAGAMLAASDSKAARLISSIRGELKRSSMDQKPSRNQ